MDTNNPYQEIELIDLLRQKDIRAYDYFYDKYAPALYGFILRIVKKEETANDVLHEIFTTIWFKINDYNPEKQRLFSWLLKITRDAAIYQRGTMYPEQNFKQPAVSGEQTIPAVINFAAFEDGSKNVLPQLKEENRALIDLCFYQGFTQYQIAETLNIPLESVSTRIKNALTDLRKSLAKK